MVSLAWFLNHVHPLGPCGRVTSCLFLTVRSTNTPSKTIGPFVLPRTGWELTDENMSVVCPTTALTVNVGGISGFEEVLLVVNV